MANYDFRTLSPVDFEELVRDLLQAAEGKRFESFGRGRDMGIDLRRSEADGGTIIVQAKHYRDSGLAKLLSTLKAECNKIKLLKPTRYILATSLSLSPSAKDDIVQVLAPHVKSTGDVLGAEDLNGLLGAHAVVERRHFKLWISSVGVLKQILNNSTYVRSLDEAERVERCVRMFAANASVDSAMDLLEKYGFIIISGAPGVGKSTLARIIAWLHIQQEWQLVAVEDFEEALRVFDSSERQIFFFDDFLGQIRLTPEVVRRIDTRLLQFIERVQKAKHSRFVVTSREYIIKQAQLASERLSDTAVELRKYVLDLAQYTRIVRAHILYNHVFFSGIPADYRDAILTNNFFLSIIDHKNFVPRLIEFLTTPANLVGINPGDYQSWILSNIENPQRLWAHPYREHLSQAAKNLVATVFFLPDRSEVKLVERAFERINAAVAMEHNLSTDPEDFRRAVQETSGSFIHVVNGMISFVNPSLQDFLDNTLAGSNIIKYTLENIIKSDQAERVQHHMQAHSDVYAIIENDFLAALETAAKSLASLPDRIEHQFSGGIAFGKEGISLSSRITIMLDWWLATRSVEIAASINLASRRLIEEDMWEDEIEESLEIFDLVRQSEYLELPGLKKITEQLSYRAFEKLQNKYQYLSTPALVALQTYFDTHKDVAVERGKKEVSREIEKLIKHISEELNNLSSASDVAGFREELKSLAEWAELDIGHLEEVISEREGYFDERESDHYNEVERHGYGSASSAEVPDAQLQSLFSTLR